MEEGQGQAVAPRPKADRRYLAELPADGMVSMKMLFEHAAKVQASDLLITAGSPPTIRVAPNCIR